MVLESGDGEERHQRSGGKYVKDIYCKTHVPEYTQAHYDQRSIEIRNALDAQRNAGKVNYEL